MRIELPVDIREARALFSRYEKSRDHLERTRYFEDAINILDDFLADNPDLPHKSFIENLKLTYIRKLLEELPGLGTLSYDDWGHYILLLYINLEVKKNIIIQKGPSLQKNLEDFFAMWGDELIREIKMNGGLQ
ncbi:MAG: hypothetical protein HY882_08840 [Deltaproteobacteria bacterium]|nr:hypothetical protein [Deltaproteobacteria bacterium]